MLKIYKSLLLIMFGAIISNLFAQTNNYSITDTHNENNEIHPCITPYEYSIIEQNISSNLRKLEFDEIIPSRFNPQKVLLSWPLKPDSSLKDCSYYRISAYVDQNTASGSFQDYNCGTNTYDAHKGTDISIWPYNFFKMDHNLVEVIAAADGIIVDKHEGEFDKNCASTTMLANYLVIKHSDGSQALYFHMKKNSLTKKAIGDKIIRGEHVGYVGSSGNSSGPHLHFEVWAGSTSSTLIDPFSGTCNSLNNSSWWEIQKAYNETSMVKVSTNTTDIVIPACPDTEIPNETNIFNIPFQGAGLPAGFAKFYIFIRNEVNALTANMEILFPNNTLYASWTYTSTMDSKSRIQGWSKKLPTTDGKYIFRASYNGTTCLDTFEIRSPLSIENSDKNKLIRVYPNPCQSELSIESKIDLDRAKLMIFSLNGKNLITQMLNGNQSRISLADLSNGIYYYRLQDKDGKNISMAVFCKSE